MRFLRNPNVTIAVLAVYTAIMYMIFIPSNDEMGTTEKCVTVGVSVLVLALLWVLLRKRVISNTLIITAQKSTMDRAMKPIDIFLRIVFILIGSDKISTKILYFRFSPNISPTFSTLARRTRSVVLIFALSSGIFTLM